jgi:hypothetical protein
MRWIDIDLSNGHSNQDTRDLLERAAAISGDLCRMQEEQGHDSPYIMRALENIGLNLFHACQSISPDAFLPTEDRKGTIDPAISDLESSSASVGYHIIVDHPYLLLPWSSLHNGVNFIIEQFPVCVAQTPSDHAARAGTSWARRREEIAFTQQALGPVSLDEIIARMRPEDCAAPEILYLGQNRSQNSEGPLLADSLNSTSHGRLASFCVQPTPPTPAGIIKSGLRYQGFHFSDNTMQADAMSAAGDFSSVWVTDEDEGPLADIMEKDVVGVDQITSLLDDINERCETGRNYRQQPTGAVQATLERAACWQTEDGPLRPEDLAFHQATPPLVFSNSYCSLTRLGQRFLECGADVFIGPVGQVPAQTAQTFASSYYYHLGKGISAAEAFRLSALDLRAQQGEWNPLWLMYGIIGHGSLALQYL